MSKVIIEFDLQNQSVDDVVTALEAPKYRAAIDAVDQDIFRHLIKYSQQEMITIALNRAKPKYNDDWDNIFVDEVQQLINEKPENREIIEGLLGYYTEALRTMFHDKLEEWDIKL